MFLLCFHPSLFASYIMNVCYVMWSIYIIILFFCSCFTKYAYMFVLHGVVYPSKTYCAEPHDVESLAKRIDFSMQTKWAHMGFWLLLLLLVFEMMAWSYTQFEDNFQFGIQNVCIRNILPKTRSAYSLAWWNNAKMVEGSLLWNTYTNIRVLRDL